jgi:hypothetical protein
MPEPTDRINANSTFQNEGVATGFLDDEDTLSDVQRTLEDEARRQRQRVEP